MRKIENNESNIEQNLDHVKKTMMKELRQEIDAHQFVTFTDLQDFNTKFNARISEL